MITEAALKELVGFQATSQDTPVLSVYLNVDPLQRTAESYKLSLRHMLDSVNGQVSREDRTRVERYVDLEYDWQGRGLVCFSCAAEDLWHAFPLMIPVADTIFAGRRAYVRPLSDLMDTYARYGVVLVEREGAHLFLFHMGSLENVSGIAGEDVKRHKQGGWSAARYQRHEDEAAYRNLKDAAEMTAEIVRSGQCRHLILGGTDDNVSQFAALLPKDVHQLVTGTINVDVNANPTDVKEKSLAMIHEADTARKAELVEELITTAAKGGPATLGLRSVLEAVYAGRARHLIIDDDFSALAYRCDNCGFVDTTPADSCPSCGSSFRLLPDAVDSLVRWALSHDAVLTVVSGDPRLVEAGSVGALLRY
jgi:peptide chain release factor subunit 1